MYAWVGEERDLRILENKKKTILQIKITGPGVRRGRVSVPDLVRLCKEAQNVVNKQAEVLEGKKTIHPGPTAHTIQRECTLELIGIKASSTVLQFGLAKSQMPLEFKEEAGVQVVAKAAETIRSLGNGNRADIDPGLLVSIYELSGVVDPKRISEIDWIVPKRENHPKKVVARITKMVRERAASRLSSPRKIIAQVDGILEMADFKAKDRKCRIEPSIGISIMCTFDAALENRIYDLLRSPVRAIGEALLQPYTDRIESVHIESISSLPSLALGAGNFFAESPISELTKLQKIEPFRDISTLAGGIPDDQDIDEFLGEIYGARR